jgi:ribonuclease D
MIIQLINDPAAVGELFHTMAGTSIVALDTEAASFHRYHDRIYLIQLSAAGVNAVIDPLGAGDLSAVGQLLANPSVEKVFHDAAYDLRLFDRQYGYHARRLFDTRIAAQFLNEPGIGLGALLEKYFGLRPDKRFQRADWSARPLSPAMLDYAAGDTSHLVELRDILLQQLRGLGREEWVAEEFYRLEDIRWTAPDADPDEGFRRLKGVRALDRRQAAVLQAVYAWRERMAASLDRAPFRIAGNEVLFELARHPVETRAELARVKGLGRDMLERRGDEILAAIGHAMALPDEELPRFERARRWEVDPEFDARVERLKQVRNRLAQELQLAPGVLCPNGTLEAVARAAPDELAALEKLPEVRSWQVRVMGNQLLEAVKEQEGKTQ